MSSRIERRLLVLRRRVPARLQEAYREQWSALAALMSECGSHAWRFVAPDDRSRQLEFLEYEASNDPRADPRARDLLDLLDAAISPAAVEEWHEDR